MFHRAWPGSWVTSSSSHRRRRSSPAKTAWCSSSSDNTDPARRSLRQDLFDHRAEAVVAELLAVADARAAFHHEVHVALVEIEIDRRLFVLPDEHRHRQ